VGGSTHGRWCDDDWEIAASAVWRSKITHTGWVTWAAKIGRPPGRLGQLGRLWEQRRKGDGLPWILAQMNK
jgi:hypothetical protein